MIDNEAIKEALAKEPYTQYDKVKIGSNEHFVRVFHLGKKVDIMNEGACPKAIYKYCSSNNAVNNYGIIVDGDECYVLKETIPQVGNSCYVVFENNNSKQVKGIITSNSFNCDFYQEVKTINGGASSSTLPTSGKYKGELATTEDGSIYCWNGTAWIASSTAVADHSLDERITAIETWLNSHNILLADDDTDANEDEE